MLGAEAGAERGLSLEKRPLEKPLVVHLAVVLRRARGETRTVSPTPLPSTDSSSSGPPLRNVRPSDRLRHHAEYENSSEAGIDTYVRYCPTATAESILSVPPTSGSRYPLFK